jgi:two-component system chemotaxis sensor kinase CheA
VALILDVLGISKIANLGQDKGGDEVTAVGESESLNQTKTQKDYLLVKLNAGSRHAIPLDLVHRLEEFKASMVERSGFQKVIRYRDVILPMISTNRAMGYEELDRKEGDVPVVVIKTEAGMHGLEVNDILDTLSTFVEVDKPICRHPGILGNLNLKDELIVVLDPREIIAAGLAQSVPDVDAKTIHGSSATRNLGRAV